MSTGSSILDDVISRAEAADILGVTPVTLLRWMKERRGPRWKQISGVFVYSRAEVMELDKQLQAFRDRVPLR